MDETTPCCETLRSNELIITKPIYHVDLTDTINEIDSIKPIEYIELVAVVKDLEEFKKTEHVENVFKMKVKTNGICVIADVLREKVDTVIKNNNVVEYDTDTTIHVV